MTASTRWVLVAAGACAVVGFALKMADLNGSSAPTPHAPDKTVASRRSASAEPTAAADDVSSHGGSGHAEPAGDAVVAARDDDAGTQPVVRHGVAPSPTPYELLDSSRTKRPPTARQLAREARREARKRGGSLAVAEAGSGAPGEIGAGGRQQGGTVAGSAGSAPGATPTPPAEPPPSAGFTSADDARYALNEQVEVPDIGKIAGRSGTLSMWLQPDWQAGNQDDATLAELGDGRLELIKNVNFLRFEFTDDAGGKGGIGAPITDWKAGEWHQITTTWSGNTFSLYIDGQLVSQTTYPGGPVQLPADAKLLIGSDFPGNRPVAPGTIGSIDVHGRPLGPGEVASQYAKATAGSRKN